MSSAMRHPEHDLVRYLDGQLPARDSAKIAGHLESCAQCRAQLQELKAALAECALYQSARKSQLQAPQEWRDLYRDFSRIDESLANDSLLVRLMRPLVHSGALRWSIATGLAVLVVLFSLNQLRQAPSVQAASILRKAVQVAGSTPRPVHRIRVRTSRQTEFTRLPGVQGAFLQLAQTQAVAAMFQAAHFDWVDPLSARAMQQWRDQQVQKTDEVSTVDNPGAPSEKLTQIRTVAAEGELSAVTLTLDPEDYPVNERLEFRDREWVELSEIAETYTENRGTGAAHVDAPVRAAESPSRPAATAPGSMASISEELQVLSALNGIGADLGDPIEVSLSDGRVKVRGFEGLSARRQDDIRTAVANVPHVEFDFSPAPAPIAPPSPSVGSAVSSTTSSAIQSRLEKQLGGHAEFDRLSTQVLDLDEVAMQHVYALHNLAQQFSAGQQAQFSAADSAVLNELTRKHTAVLAEKISRMEQILGPSLSSLGGTAASASPARRASWQVSADDVYKDARRVEMLLTQALGMSKTTTSANALPSDLLTAMAELRANIDECQALVSK